MTVKMTYTGLLDEQTLFQTFGFIASTPDVEIDKKHGTITYSDPNDKMNEIVVDFDHLAVKNGVAKSGTITSVDFISHGKDALDITGLHVDASGQAVAAGDDGNNFSALDFYSLLANNLTGTMVSTGDKYDNFLEVGGGSGKATVDAGKGDDVIYVWHAKDAVIDGGKGQDFIDFSPLVSNTYHTIGKMAVDLANGTGTAFGSTLKVSNVENLEATDAVSVNFRGDGQDNVLIGSYMSGNNTLTGGGGDDTIEVRNWYGKTHADGGSGDDTLTTILSSKKLNTVEHNLLDLENQDLNTGSFKGGTFKNFEVYQTSAASAYMAFDFIGSSKGEEAEGSVANDSLNGRDGDDVLIGSAGADTLTGGAGADHFQFNLLSDSTADPAGRDRITDFSHAEHDKIDLSHISSSLNVTSSFIGTDAFDGQSNQVRYEFDSDGNTVVQFNYINVFGDTTADLEIVLDGKQHLVKGDFML